MQASLFDKDALVSTQNLPLGVLRLRELIAHEKLSQQGAQNLIAELIDNELVTYRKMYLKDREIKNLIAIGEPILSLYYKMARESIPSRSRSRNSIVFMSSFKEHDSRADGRLF